MGSPCSPQLPHRWEVTPLRCDEEPIVEAVQLGQDVELGIDRADRPEQRHGLVNGMCPEVQQHPAARRRQACRRRRLFQVRLEGDDVAQGTGCQHLADRQQVRVPPPVLVDAEEDAGPRRQLYRCPRRHRIRGERLVAHHRQSQSDGFADQGEMGGQGRGDDHRVHPGRRQVGQAVVGRNGRGVLRQFGASLRGAGDDPGQLAPGSGRYQRGVEVSASHAVADQPDPHRGSCHGLATILGSMSTFTPLLAVWANTPHPHPCQRPSRND